MVQRKMRQSSKVALNKLLSSMGKRKREVRDYILMSKVQIVKFKLSQTFWFVKRIIEKMTEKKVMWKKQMQTVAENSRRGDFVYNLHKKTNAKVRR